ncbi:hypothetical protein DSM112329_01283 [Paraconexibacter sp. AEG42_29]|uniref:DUF11 domain-containing protein n=1 Tax=Paraconexibacter sp. AEG42_29 TaxID=2997339 RepID=A0AAU7AS77_9ACTN
MGSGTSVVRWVTAALIATVAALGLLTASASADQNFSKRFQTNDTGDILAIANTLMTCPPGSSSNGNGASVPCATAQQVGPTSAANDAYNNNFNMAFVDTDGDPATTLNSSTAQLSLPAGAQVLFAGLYWAGDASGGSNALLAARNTVDFKVPGGSYQQLVAANNATDFITSTANPARFQAFKDVTSLVAAAGNGTYSVGDVQATTGADHYAGWSLVIAYRDTAQPARNLTVFDGLRSVTNGQSVTIPVSGFLTPPQGQVKTELGFITYEGDHGLVGDSARLNTTTLGDAQHPADNFFNSRISRDGSLVGNKNPNYANQMGMDVAFTPANGVLANNATSANITVSTVGDVFIPGVITFATEIYAPKIDQTKTVTDDNGGDVLQGDVLTYTVTGKNNGLDGATGFVLRDPIPANTTFVPGSIVISNPSGASTGGASDATDNDRAEFEAGNNRVVARLGVGSNQNTGGNVMPGNTYSLTFKVKVNGPATFPVPSGTQLTNTATASFFSQTTATPLTAVSTAQTQVVAAPDLTINKARTGAAFVIGGTSAYTLKTRNIGDAPTSGTVTISDPLPSNLTVANINAPNWNCGASTATTVTCTRTDALGINLAYDDIVVTVNVNPGTPINTPLPNTATVSGGGDSKLGNNQSTDTSPATDIADIRLEKTASKSPVNIGEQLTFTLKVTNLGPSPATSVAISDAIPGEFTYISNDGGCVFTPPTGTLGCAVGTLASGASKTIVVTVRAEADGATRSITNTATASAQQNDPTPGNNTATSTVAITGVDLALTKEVIAPAPPASVSVGGQITYRITVKNNGPSDGTAIVVKDALPTNLSNVTTNKPAQCDIVAGELTCLAGSLAAGAEYTVEVTGTVTGGTDVTNNAGVGGAEPDPDPGNNTGTTTTPVTAPNNADLGVVKTAGSATATTGTNLVYTLNVTNTGPDTATGAVVTDSIPAGTTFVSASNGCTESGGIVTCALGDIPSGDSRQVTITVAVTATTGDVVNTATVTGTSIDPNPGNNTSTVTTPVGANADVSIVKTVDNATPISGDTIVYTLVARNNGNEPANGVVVKDTLPAGVTFQSVTGPNCTQAAGVVTCNVGTLAPGATATIKITAKVSALPGGVSAHDHQFTVNKVENQVDIDPGQTRTVSIDCGPGFVLTDGSLRTDAVDQGTGDLGSVQVITQKGTSPSGYTATVRNDATGRAQAKVFGVCLSSSTSNEAGHSHDVIVTDPVSTTTGVVNGRPSTTIECGPGKTPIQPGWDGLGTGRILTSEPTPGGTGWTFVADGAATFSVRCLDQNVTVVNGHTHTLGLERRTKTITVAPGQTAEVEVICGDNAKGIVGDWSIDPGLVPLGNDPRPKARTFKFYNPTGAPLNARVGLLCLNDRTGPATGTDRIINTGTVSTTSPDSNAANNSSSATVVVGGSSLLNRSGRARVSGSTVLVRGLKATVRVACLKGGPACVGTVQIKTMTNRKVASKKYAVKAAKTGNLVITAKAFKTLKRAKFIVTGRDGRKVTQTIKFKKAPVKKATAKKKAATKKVSIKRA